MNDLYLVRTGHVLVKRLHCNLVDERVRDPGAIVPKGHLADLVVSHFGHGDFVRLVVTLNRNLRRHATHCSDFAPDKVLTQGEMAIM